MGGRNFRAEMERQIAEIPTGAVPRLLLHSCCGPCSSAVLETLTPYFEIVLFYYNPNIDTKEEFEKRLEMQKIVIDHTAHAYPITLRVPPYDDGEFWAAVKGAEHTPERGERCRRCIALRMREAAAAAKTYGCEAFTTTLSVSPHKDCDYINACGEEISAQTGMRYLYSDFKKQNGYARSVQLSREMQIYRQNYCGCVMSHQEADERARRHLERE